MVRLHFTPLLVLAVAASPAMAADAAYLDYDLDGSGDVQEADGAVASIVEVEAEVALDGEETTLDGETRWPRDYVTIAAGVLTAPSYNGSDDRTILPALMLRGRVKGFSFSTRGTNLRVDLIREHAGAKTDFKLGPMINLRSERSGSTGDAQVNATGKRDRALELGLTAGLSHRGVLTGKYDQIGLRVTALHDVSGVHDSWLVSPTIEYGTPLSRTTFIGMSASVNFYGKGYGRTYYDVTAAESLASGLAVYSDAGRKTEAGKMTLGLAAAKALSGDLRKGFVLVGGAQYGRVMGSHARSPIVEDAGNADQWLGGLGIAYNF
ncbi:MAG: MipA/OmpV family protein [Blastomonas sp.]